MSHRNAKKKHAMKKSFEIKDIKSKRLSGSFAGKIGLLIVGMSTLQACSDYTDCDNDVTRVGDTSTYYCDVDNVNFGGDLTICQDRDVTRVGDTRCDL